MIHLGKTAIFTDVPIYLGEAMFIKSLTWFRQHINCLQEVFDDVTSRQTLSDQVRGYLRMIEPEMDLPVVPQSTEKLDCNQAPGTSPRAPAKFFWDLGLKSAKFWGLKSAKSLGV